MVEETITSFEQLRLMPELIEGLKKENITQPTEIQSKAIPAALQNKDVAGQSETGTGKTLAYLLPVFQKIDTTQKEMQAIIMAPTHELAIQILRQIELLAKNSGLPVTSTSVIGNVNIARQIEKLKERPHVIVGSPGRILELIKKRKISAHLIKTLVVDEADKLLDDNNMETVKAVIKSTLKDRQILLYSASMSQKTIDKAKDILKEHEVIKVQEKLAVAPDISHMYFAAEQRDKIEVLRKLVRIINPQKALVFINKTEETEMTIAKLKYHQLNAEGIHGGSRKNERKKAMDDFRAGRLQLLVASDIAARGLDIGDVTHVFNLDIPENAKDYLHRVGRTGRAGKSGVAVSIATEREEQFIKLFEKMFKISILPKKMYMGKIEDVKLKTQNKRKP